MREKDFDQFFRDRLTKHSSPVPEDMWQRIQGKKDDRRALAFWWWGLGAGLIVIALIVVRPSQTTTAPSTQGNPMPSTPTTPIPPSTQNKTSKKTISLKNPTKPLEPSTTSLERSITSQESLTNPVESPTPPPSNISAPKEITLHLPALANLKNKQPIKAAVPKSAKDSIKNKKTLANIDLYASPDNSYNLGARLLIPIGKNLALITGFQYTSINHSKAHLDSAYRRPVNRLIEVPVLFAYTRQIKPTTNVGIHTGLILSNETSLYLGLHLERRLDPHFSFFAEPYYRYRLSGEQLSPLSIAVSFGLRYAIKK